MPQCGLHIKALGNDMLHELKKKLDLAEANPKFEGLRERCVSLESRQETLLMELHAYANSSEEVGNQVNAISLQLKAMAEQVSCLPMHWDAPLAYELSLPPPHGSNGRRSRDSSLGSSS